jgi:hypothetical protein
MPTGYTYDIPNGMTFEQFVLGCARAIDVLFSPMREEPMDAPIPEKFKVDPYYTRRVEEAKTELQKVINYTDAECEEGARIANQESMARVNEITTKELKSSNAYSDMLLKVLKWKPPSKLHEGLKKFMIEQLSQEISGATSVIEDLNKQVPTPITAAEWKTNQIADAEHKLTNAEIKLQQEIEAVELRNRWVSDLKRSLGLQVEDLNE